MNINFDEHTSMEDIQSSFHEQYPYLKLEFYRHPHLQGEASWFNDKLGKQSLVKKEASMTGNQSINAGGNQTVADFESEFFQKTGIAVQVMRFSGRVWIQTTETDDWTLQQQNEKGYEDSKLTVPDKPEDFDLQEDD
ncbi:hypothetical protein [Niabella beijingensis]|uniref:hypothetical protein n=1 Tax=Niabella beijingensis TaxID=2872700 RepID=UPI001CBBA0F6|nr:hypothetical protein [Niabella beijingensis]MBZ4191625.1 hypothetical protein [Niabella beijingensis]